MEHGANPQNGRIFLVVVDETEEYGIALKYACLRARNTGGRVALLYVMEPVDRQEWMAVEDLMREERRTEAEQTLHHAAKNVQDLCSSLPVLFLREGERHEELLKLIDKEPAISVLVLATSTGSEGPGPLISYLTGRGLSRLKIPMTIVPGSLGDEQLNAIS